MTVEAFEDGYLTAIPKEEGEMADVGAALAIFQKGIPKKKRKLPSTSSSSSVGGEGDPVGGGGANDSLSKVLSDLRSNDKLSDVTLEGNGGRKLRANRCILAIRSEVFRSMLFGRYAEMKSTIVRVGWCF